MFDYGYLSEFLREAGFRDIHRQSYLQSSFLSSEDLKDLDPVQARNVSLYVEGTR